MIVKDILEWIESLPKWQQQLGYLIFEKKHITEEELQNIYEVFKIEMSLEKGEIPIISKKEYTDDVENFHDIKWCNVGNLHGVNKLKTDSVLSVSNELTVVYGENGSGKSGYTRLLNNAFISRGDLEILPNIYSEHPETISADFLFCIDGNPTKYKYPDDKNEMPFKTIRIFDSTTASDDMNKESAIDFAPSELSFFDSFLSACIEIQTKLDNERSEKRRENPTLKYFPHEGKALEHMEALSEKTKIEELKKVFAISEEEKALYEKSKKEKIYLVGLDINKQFTLINQVIDVLNNAIKKYTLFAQAVSDENVSIYNQQISFLKKCRIINNMDGASMFSGDNIEMIGTTEWKDFLVAAKNYYDKITCHDKCPLCGQEIGDKDLIFKYWKYLESDAESNLKMAREAIRISKEGIDDLDLLFVPESSVYEQWLLDNFPKETETIKTAFTKAYEIKKEIIESLENERPINPILVISPDIKDLVIKVEEKIRNLNHEKINQRIHEYEEIENQYIDKTRVIDLIPTISSYIDYLKWDSKAEKSKIKTRNITVKQKDLFEKYVTSDYLRTFKEECQKLKANFNVEIVSRGSSGQTLKKLQIKGKVPGKVLSEGEQKAISIANFLTEVQMDVKNIGIVLDDPVSSLDHKRRSLIVRRLSEEAKKRQVVIFTHEITFFMELKAEAENKGILFEQETIRNLFNEPGDISPTIPWQGMSVKERTKKLRNDLQSIISLYKSGDMDAYYYKAKDWCELLRESWERAVEEILFNDAIQRYDPRVQTTRLRKAPFNQKLYFELERGMTECSAWCHDQARAINGDVPTIDDLKNYIDCFENYCKENRPNKN